MSRLPLVLKLIAPVFILVGLLHLTLGLNADVLLGAALPLAVITDPVLDSQNRFYGVAFAVYGFLIFLAASDLTRYQVMLRILLAVFFAAGCARLVSVLLFGFPSALVIVLLGSELLLPPVLYLWLRRQLQGR